MDPKNAYLPTPDPTDSFFNQLIRMVDHAMREQEKAPRSEDHGASRTVHCFA